MDILRLIGREEELFVDDVSRHEHDIRDQIERSSFLVIGAAGSIGQAVTKEIFKRNPRKLHVVDLSENNLVELVRDIRSSFGYISGEFKNYALDVGSQEYEALIKADGQYDFVLNLSALKHVRSEKDPFTLMRMIHVNILNTDKTAIQAIEKGSQKYFCVSTDKAANPVNMMGASKRIMEMFLMRRSVDIDISMARFANVAFSDGSLLHGFDNRIKKRQPLVAPNYVKRYFIIPKESGELCLMSCLYGENRDVFFPKLDEQLHLMTFSDIAVNYLHNLDYEPYLCETEDEARELVKSLPQKGKWPCLFIESDTTGEKDFEEFYTDDEILDLSRFNSIGIIKNELSYDKKKIESFEEILNTMIADRSWSRQQLLELFHEMIPDFGHKETGRYLDGKM